MRLRELTVLTGVIAAVAFAQGPAVAQFNAEADVNVGGGGIDADANVGIGGGGGINADADVSLGGSARAQSSMHSAPMPKAT